MKDKSTIVRVGNVRWANHNRRLVQCDIEFGDGMEASLEFTTNALQALGAGTLALQGVRPTGRDPNTIDVEPERKQE